METNLPSGKLTTLTNQAQCCLPEPVSPTGNKKCTRGDAATLRVKAEYQPLYYRFLGQAGMGRMRGTLPPAGEGRG